jgi:hypothetical protein
VICLQEHFRLSGIRLAAGNAPKLQLARILFAKPVPTFAEYALAGGCWSRRQVSNWIDSGGDTPRLCTDDGGTNSQGRYPRRLKAPLTIGFAVLSLALASQLGRARDRGQYANASPELKAWFEGLKSGKGPCCSGADGAAVSDVDWESGNGHYRVRIEGEWGDVPDEAVISEPNRVGRTMVWPIRGYLGLTIRCFMPGSVS